jgi:tRNA pseudouridine38-40 synthase
MTRFRLLIAYDGRPFKGWQRQADGVVTVQGRVEEALTRMNGGRAVALTGASRTDAGVHAEGQVAVFDYEGPIRPKRWLKGLNALTPDAITVRAVEEVAQCFEPRFDAVGKHYRYWLWHGSAAAPPLWRARAWEVFRPLDVEAMKEGAKHLLGEHDFGAFRDAHCQARSTVRRVDEITLAPQPREAGWLHAEEGEAGGELVCIDFRGSAFLKYMIRIIVGTLAEVGMGRRTPESIAEVLASRDRRRAGRTGDPQGLTLAKIFYPPEGERIEKAKQRRARFEAERRAEGEVSGDEGEDDGE